MKCRFRLRKPPFYPLNYGDQPLVKEYADYANMSKLLVLISYHLPKRQLCSPRSS